MATITKPKTLDEIESLASKESANVLVLDENSALKKLQLIDNNGFIPNSIIDNSSLITKIDEAHTIIEKLISTNSTLSNQLFEIQSRVDILAAKLDDYISKAKEIKTAETEEVKAAEEVKVVEEPETTTKAVKKPRKTTKKATKKIETAD